MKTTEFFLELKRVVNDCSINTVFSYGIHHYNRFYQIFLFTEPTGKVKALCDKFGFSINENMMIKAGDHNQTIKRTIWEVMPTDMKEVQFVTEDDFLVSVNENVIIASEKTMKNAGLSSCIPNNDDLAIWTYQVDTMLWTPIMNVYKEPVKDNMTMISTHMVGPFYCADLTDDLIACLTSLGLQVK